VPGNGTNLTFSFVKKCVKKVFFQDEASLYRTGIGSLGQPSFIRNNGIVQAIVGQVVMAFDAMGKRWLYDGNE
jgi:hypothetical protein